MKKQNSQIQEKEELLNLLKEKSVRHGSFRLASGATSDFYVDCRMTSLAARGAYLIGRLFLKLSEGWDYDLVGGMTLGADPLITAFSLASLEAKRPVDGFIVRKEAKNHGTSRSIEGNSVKGKKVLILEDVITTAGSSIKAIEAVEKEGGQIVGILVVLDRCEGGFENLTKRGYQCRSLFKRSDFAQ